MSASSNLTDRCCASAAAVDDVTSGIWCGCGLRSRVLDLRDDGDADDGGERRGIVPDGALRWYGCCCW